MQFAYKIGLILTVILLLSSINRLLMLAESRKPVKASARVISQRKITITLNTTLLGSQNQHFGRNCPAKVPMGFIEHMWYVKSTQARFHQNLQSSAWSLLTKWFQSFPVASPASYCVKSQFQPVTSFFNRKISARTRLLLEGHGLVEVTFQARYNQM